MPKSFLIKKVVASKQEGNLLEGAKQNGHKLVAGKEQRKLFIFHYLCKFSVTFNILRWGSARISSCQSKNS